jgi:hypothetical protein
MSAYSARGTHPSHAVVELGDPYQRPLTRLLITSLPTDDDCDSVTYHNQPLLARNLASTVPPSRFYDTRGLFPRSNFLSEYAISYPVPAFRIGSSVVRASKHLYIAYTLTGIPSCRSLPILRHVNGSPTPCYRSTTVINANIPAGTGVFGWGKLMSLLWWTSSLQQC